MDDHIPINQAPPTKLDFNLLIEAANILKDNLKAYGLFALIPIAPVIVCQLGFGVFYFFGILQFSKTTDAKEVLQFFAQTYSMLGGLTLLNIFVFSFVACGVIRMTLLALQGKTIDYKDGYRAIRSYPAMLGAALTMALLTMIGACFCFVGAYFVIAFCLLTFPIIVNENLSITAAMQRSADLLKGQTLLAFAMFFVATMVVNFSSMALYIPFIVTIPWLFILLTLMYRNVAGLPYVPPTPTTEPTSTPPPSEEPPQDLV